MAQVVKRSFLVREVWSLNPEPIKSPTRCQRLATAATFEVWSLADSWSHNSLTIIVIIRSII